MEPQGESREAGVARPTRVPSRLRAFAVGTIAGLLVVAGTWTALRAGAGWPLTPVLASLLFLAAFKVSFRLLGPAAYGLAWCIGILLPGAAALVVSFFGDAIVKYASRIDFDSDRWKASVGERKSDRLRMVDDLVSSGSLDGTTKAEVASLLGPDDSTDSGFFPIWDAVYWLGPERGFMSIDSEWLVLRYDPGGRVREYRVVRD